MTANATLSPPGMKITALALSDAAKLLSKIGGRVVTVESLQKDIESGAPVNADGTLNLIHFAAWLAREVAQRVD
ncbi:MAG: hypothetical protein V1809_01865 [Planctomycetota bacterium]